MINKKKIGWKEVIKGTTSQGLEILGTRMIFRW
jgi:hypothetical protein